MPPPTAATRRPTGDSRAHRSPLINRNDRLVIYCMGILVSAVLAAAARAGVTSTRRGLAVRAVAVRRALAGCGLAHRVPGQPGHSEAPEATRMPASGLVRTLLRSNAYMQNVLALAPAIAMTSGFGSSAGQGRAGLVDARDVGAQPGEPDDAGPNGLIGERLGHLQTWRPRSCPVQGVRRTRDRANPGSASLRIISEMSGKCRCPAPSSQHLGARPAGAGRA